MKKLFFIIHNIAFLLKSFIILLTAVSLNSMGSKILIPFSSLLFGAEFLIDASFPDSSKKGCFFHFSQAIFRKIQSLGLQVRCKDDEDFAHKVSMLAALAFVPEPDVINNAFEAV